MVLGRGANSVFPVLRRLVRFGLGGRMGSDKQFVSWIYASNRKAPLSHFELGERVIGEAGLGRC
jgi:NAD dependent epimerase/dehydratase family enzyme